MCYCIERAIRKTYLGIAVWMHTAGNSGVQGCYTIFPTAIWRVTLTSSYLAVTSSGFLLSQAFLFQRILENISSLSTSFLVTHLKIFLQPFSFTLSQLPLIYELKIFLPIHHHDLYRGPDSSSLFWSTLPSQSCSILFPLTNSSQWCQVQADLFSWPCSPSLYLFTCSTLSSDVEF